MGDKRARSRPTRVKKAKHPSLLKRINRHAAGIDCGSETHFVAVPPERDEEPVRSFKTFTSDLRRLADWLEACKIKTVAMESTGVYWIPIFEILEDRGFDVVLVNSRHVKNVPGRKTDVLDCQWIQELHSVGLLRGSFRPDAEIATLRAYLRHREKLIQGAASHIRRMQKALIEMNLQLHNVISDITGVTGMRILRDIVAGVTDPDDAELGMGGTIPLLLSQGLAVGVLDLTDGEPTPLGSPEIRARETTVIIGESGAGKTQLMLAVLGNAGGVDLREAGVGKRGASTMGAPGGRHIATHRVGR